MNQTELLIQAPVSKSAPSTSSKVNSPSKPESSFQVLLQQKGQGEATLVAPIAQLSIENAMEMVTNTSLYQELAAAMMAPTIIPSQIQQPSPSMSLLPQAPVSPTLPVVSELSLSSFTAPFSTPQVQTDTSLTALQQTQVPTIATLSAPSSSPQDAKMIPAFTQQLNQTAELTQGDWETVSVQQSGETLAKPLFQNPQTVPVKVGETPALDTQSSDFDLQLSNHLSQTMEQGTQKIAVKLSPEYLGTMVVEFTRAEDGSLHIILQASNPKAADLLSQHTTGLSTLLQNNVQVPVHVEVHQQQNSSQYDQQQNQQQNHGQGNSQQNSQQQREQQQKQDFLDQLRLGIRTLTIEAS